MQANVRIVAAAALGLFSLSASASINLSTGVAAYDVVQTDSNGNNPVGLPAPAQAVNPNLFALTQGYWVANNNVAQQSAQWISVDPFGGQVDSNNTSVGSLQSNGVPKSGSGDTYWLFSTTFQGNANNTLSGLWFTDNQGLQVKVNGVDLNSSTVFSTGVGPSAAFSYTLPADGAYTVSFLVKNFAQSSGNPFGLNVNMTAVPEPSTFLAGIGAMSMLGLFGWRSRK